LCAVQGAIRDLLGDILANDGVAVHLIDWLHSMVINYIVVASFDPAEQRPALILAFVAGIDEFR
jgi:hypothetical protein